MILAFPVSRYFAERYQRLTLKAVDVLQPAVYLSQSLLAVCPPPRGEPDALPWVFRGTRFIHMNRHASTGYAEDSSVVFTRENSIVTFLPKILFGLLGRPDFPMSNKACGKRCGPLFARNINSAV